MRDMFERLRDGGDTAFHELIEQRIEEDLQLDFKRKASPERPFLNDDDKRRVGEALSAYSNSAGGLLVLGVDCRPGGDGVDCVQGLEPIINPAKIASDINGMLGSLLQPSNDGIEITHVESAERPGFGYILIWVPRSDRRPHQSRAAGHFKYFKRSGRDFHPMEHYELEDQFTRTPTPSLEVTFMPAEVDEMANGYNIKRIIGLRNPSSYMAKFPFLNVWDLDNLHVSNSGLRGDGKFGLRHTPVQRTHQFSGGSHDVIHPDGFLQVAVLITQVRKVGADYFIGRQPSGVALSRIQYRLGCEGMRSVTRVLEFFSMKGVVPPS